MLGGRWEGVGRALGGRWDGVGMALGWRWEVVGLASGEGRPGSLIYRQIKSLHCSGYLLVNGIIKQKQASSISLMRILSTCLQTSPQRP